jgi:hypothetical protein
MEAAVDDAPVLTVYSRMTYKMIQGRFHEFMISIMGMTVFDGGELWLPMNGTGPNANGGGNTLRLVSAVYTSSAMKKWMLVSQQLRLDSGADVPGQCFASLQSVWENNYHLFGEGSKSASRHPRSMLAKLLGIQTAFAVPVPGLGELGACGVLAFYSSKKVIDSFTAYDGREIYSLRRASVQIHS